MATEGSERENEVGSEESRKERVFTSKELIEIKDENITLNRIDSFLSRDIFCFSNFTLTGVSDFRGSFVHYLPLFDQGPSRIRLSSG